jgi:hypothetical protein
MIAAVHALSPGAPVLHGGTLDNSASPCTECWNGLGNLDFGATIFLSGRSRPPPRCPCCTCAVRIAADRSAQACHPAFVIDFAGVCRHL